MREEVGRGMDYEDILYQLRQDLISIQFNSLPEFVFLKQALECEGFRLSNNRSYSESGYFEKFSKFSNSSMLTTVYSPIRKIVTYEQFRESRSKKQGGGKDMKLDYKIKKTELEILEEEYVGKKVIGENFLYYLNKGYTLLNTINKLKYKKINDQIIYYSEDQDIEPRLTKLSIEVLIHDKYEISELPKKEKVHFTVEDKIKKILTKSNLTLESYTRDRLEVGSTRYKGTEYIYFNKEYKGIWSSIYTGYVYHYKTFFKLFKLFKKNKYSFLENPEKEESSCQI